MTVPIPEEAIEAAAREAVEHFEMPFMARVRDFTNEQVEAGELRAADVEADRKNRAAVEAVVRAAVPLIVAAELDRMINAMGRLWPDPMGEFAAEQAHAARVMKQSMIDAMKRRSASVLRGEGAT